MKTISLIPLLAALTFALAATLNAAENHTDEILDESIPKGKVYVYKQVDGVNREMEIYFPKGIRP